MEVVRRGKGEVEQQYSGTNIGEVPWLTNFNILSTCINMGKRNLILIGLESKESDILG